MERRFSACGKGFGVTSAAKSNFAVAVSALKGHAFRRAEKRAQDIGFSRCGSLPQGLKAELV